MSCPRRTVLLWVGVFLFCLDRFLKFLVLRAEHADALLAGNWVEFRAFLNPTLLGLRLPPLLAFGATLAVLIFFGIAAVEKKLARLPSWAVLFGGVGNLIDRGLYSGVVDFVRVGNVTFNLADLLIWSGIILAAASLFRRKPS